MTDHFFDDLKARYRLIDVLFDRFGRKVTRHRKFRCVAPGHDDKNPSANLTDDHHWYCHGCQTGGDVLDLVQHALSCDRKEAIRFLTGTDPPPQARDRPAEPTGPEAVFAFEPIPSEIRREMQSGKPISGIKSKNLKRIPPLLPEGIYTYHREDGAAVAIVLRTAKEDGGKEIRPLRYDPRHGLVQAGYKQPEKPPLYDLPLLLKHPEKPVLVVEGEKCVQRAKAVLPDWVVTTWIGGTGQVTRADFELLKGRDVTLWPDNDDIGRKAMAHIAGVLQQDCAVVEAQPHWRKGYDVADALEEAKPPEVALLIRAAKRRPPGAVPEVPTSRDSRWLPDAIEMVTNKDGGVDTTSEANVWLVLTHHPEWKNRLQWDVFDRAFLFDGQDHRPDTPYMVLQQLGQRWSFKVSIAKLGALMEAVAIRNEVNRLKLWLEALPWDGRPRHLLDYAGVVRSPYALAIGRRWLLGLVHRLLVPGWKVDHMLVLEGRQGIGKSRFFETLGHFSGRNTYVDIQKLTGDRDALMNLTGKAIADCSELVAQRNVNPDAFKALVSAGVDTYRPPYGRKAIDVPRTAVFAATTNSRRYLRDQTGNRRFLPAQMLNEPDIAGLERDQEQLLAEAVHAVLAGEQNHLTAEEDTMQRGEVGERLLPLSWRDKVESYIEDKTIVIREGIWGPECLNVPPDRRRNDMYQQIIELMDELGFDNGKRMRVGGRREWCYVKRDADPDIPT